MRCCISAVSSASADATWSVAANDLQIPCFFAYEINLSDEELAKAPSEADADFDWGDRESEINSYYRAPPYWIGI